MRTLDIAIQYISIEEMLSRFIYVQHKVIMNLNSLKFNWTNIGNKQEKKIKCILGSGEFWASLSLIKWKL